MYKANSCYPLEKAFYRPIDAAIRWCELMTHEGEILKTSWEYPGLLARTFPQWPCLQINTEKILDAVRNCEIPYGCFGLTVQAGTIINSKLLTVRHTDLKRWMLRHHPDQRPVFLFGKQTDEEGRISVGTYLTLRADRDALEAQLKTNLTEYQAILEELRIIGLERDTLHSLVQAGGVISDRSETGYQRVIGTLIETLLGSSPAGKPNSVFDSQASIVDSITSHYEGVPGLSKRSLDDKFASARRSLSRV